MSRLLAFSSRTGVSTTFSRLGILIPAPGNDSTLVLWPLQSALFFYSAPTDVDFGDFTI